MANEFVTRTPHPSVRWLASSYIGYRQHGLTLPVHRGLPSRHITLVISLAEPIRMLSTPRSGLPERASALVGGMHTSPVLLAQDAYQCGLHLELNPLAARALFGLPAAELADGVVHLADLGVRALTELPERLADTPTWEHRFALVDDALRRAAGEPVFAAAEVLRAWRRLLAEDGQVRVGDLSAEVGWSRRHLSERFRQELGLSPKQVARVARFERARVELFRTPQRGLADLAAVCGYYDQAHLTAEWHALAGCTPGTWIREELPFLQSDPAGEYAESSA